MGSMKDGDRFLFSSVENLYNCINLIKSRKISNYLYNEGGFGIVWLFMLLIFTSDSPLNHGFISQTEKNYIIANIPPANVQKKVKSVSLKIKRD